MEYDHKVLKNKIEDYFSDKITLNEFVRWLKSVYSDFLTKGFLEIENLCAYPLLMRLDIAYENDYDEVNVKTNFLNDELKYIYNILCGYDDKALFYRIYLPWKYNIMSVHSDVYTNYLQFRQAVNDYISCKMENYNEIKQQIKILNERKKSKGLLNLLEVKILSLAEQIFSDDESEMMQVNIPCLYPDIRSDRTDKRLLILLSDYLECMLGEKAMIAEVTYLKGNAGINIYCDDI